MKEQRRLLQNGFEGLCAFQDSDLRQLSEVVPLAAAQRVRFIDHDRQFGRRLGLDDLLDEVYRAHIVKRWTEHHAIELIFLKGTERLLACAYTRDLHVLPAQSFGDARPLRIVSI